MMLSFMSLGGSEIMVLLLIFLLLFGAKKIPELARSLGRAKREFTNAHDEVSGQVQEIQKKAKDLLN
jgi:sec-independent protein translocase protein TatA